MRRRRDEVGQVAGVETLAFGVLVFVIGTLIATNAWAIVQTRTTGDAVAREYLRAYTDARSAPEARAAARQIASLVATERGVRPDRLRIVDPGRFGPCELAEVRVELDVPLVRLPLVGAVGTATVRVDHRERVDPFRILDPPIRGGATCTS